MCRYFFDDDEIDNEYVADQSESGSENFHPDEFNKDISDDDMIFDKNANRIVHEDYDNFQENHHANIKENFY